MFCSSCGIAVLDTQAFCTTCGFNLKVEPDTDRASMQQDESALDDLSRRISEVENRLPKTHVLNKKFLPRALAVYGHALAGGLPIFVLIVIVATIGIPSLLRSRQASHEAAAIATLRTINTAQITYLATVNGKFGNLSDLSSNDLVPATLVQGPVSGYNFTITVDPDGKEFIAEAVPATFSDGRYGYFITPDGAVRYSVHLTLAPNGAAGSEVTR